MPQSPPVQNFGGELRFTPDHFYHPPDEATLLDILNRHKFDQVRAIGSRHAWNTGIQSPVIISLENLQTIQIHRRAANSLENIYVSVGAGCQIKHLL